MNMTSAHLIWVSDGYNRCQGSYTISCHAGLCPPMYRCTSGRCCPAVGAVAYPSFSHHYRIPVYKTSYNRLGRCPVFYGRMVPAVFRRDSCLTTAHCPLGMTCCLTLTGRQCLYARSL
ncbi:putative WAP-type 'four-disulfide core' [Trichinella spiralis]|uniref:putative WAP-type 'four-disulfide core' n=1 Tax=Trichinella spiralis TaxID=6334 RepID=UPI0001EFB23C|nr:putative WAP-type 'four-disulfide core' [Trichinella spiralis]